MSKKTEFYERQEQREADRPEIKDGFSFMDKEAYDSRPLTRWLDKSGKPIEDHPELPAEHETKEILKRKIGMPMETLLKSKIVRETLKAKSYDLDEVETRRVTIEEDLTRLLEKLADDKPVARNNDKDKPEVTILKRGEADQGEDSTIRQPDDKEVVRALVVEMIPEDILRLTTLRKKKVTFRKEAEHLGPDQESSEKSKSEGDNLEQQDAYGGEELEKIAVSRKPFRKLSCNSIVRTNLKPDDDREVLRRIVCVKLKGDIHSPEN